jgi:hypothetical protein
VKLGVAEKRQKNVFHTMAVAALKQSRLFVKNLLYTSFLLRSFPLQVKINRSLSKTLCCVHIKKDMRRKYFKALI